MVTKENHDAEMKALKTQLLAERKSDMEVLKTQLLDEGKAAMTALVEKLIQDNMENIVATFLKMQQNKPMLFKREPMISHAPMDHLPGLVPMNS